MRDSTRQAERLAAIHLRYVINTHLADQEISTPAQIGTAVGLLATEAVPLLTGGSAAMATWRPCRRLPAGSASRCHWRASACRRGWGGNRERGAGSDRRHRAPGPADAGRRTGGARRPQATSPVPTPPTGGISAPGAAGPPPGPETLAAYLAAHARHSGGIVRTHLAPS